MFCGFYSGQNPSRLAVRVGSSTRETGGVLYDVSRIVMHPSFVDLPILIDNDYSLMELSKEITFTRAVQPIPLPSSSERPQTNESCLVSGWGITENDKISNVLRIVRVPIANKRKCNQNYRGKMILTQRMICAGYDNGGKDGEKYK